MRPFFHKTAVRGWLILLGVALLVRTLALLPWLTPDWSLRCLLGGAGGATMATVGLAVLLGRHLRRQGRLAPWELPGIGIMIAVLVVTTPIMRPSVQMAGWQFTLGWLIATAALVMGILGLMAQQDRLRDQRNTRLMEARRAEEE